MTAQLYLALIGAVALERLVEVWLSQRNLAWARARGGVEHGASHYPWMVALHTLLLVGCVVEGLAAGRWRMDLGIPMLVLVAATMALRYWAISSLGRQWNTRVVVIPGAGRVGLGPYRWIDHPNYVAVVVEVFALPLVFGCWRTALVASLANAWVLWVRIGVENSALEQLAAVESDG